MISPRPLDGILVADFSRVLAGPLATMMLADLGATVIKVERPEVGDDTRQWGPPWTEHSSSYFESVNRSKRSLTLDLTVESDLADAYRLVERADVMIQNFRVGGLTGYGLDFPAAISRNPRLVYCSVSGFGPHTDLPGYDFIVQAVGGLMSITGDPDGEPTKVGVAVVDVLTGKDAVIGILAALRQRELTGAGQHVEVNLLSSLLGSLANQAAGYLTTGKSPQRLGNIHPSIAPYETLRCADGLLAIAAGNDRQFRHLTEALGAPHLAQDTRFRDNSQRVSYRTELIAELQARSETFSVASLAALLTQSGVPVGRVGDIASAIDLAESLGLAPVQPIGPGHADQLRSPITFSQSPTVPATPPPNLGQHSARIREWLHKESAELAELLEPST